MTDIQLVEAIYAAMQAKDFSRLFELLDPDVVITQDPRLPWGGHYEGHEGFATFGLALTGNIDSSVAIEAIFEADGDIVQVGRTRGAVRANGVEFDLAEVHRWTIRDGLAVAAHFSIDTPAMLRCLAEADDDEG
jgi:ketosteroid isomerase-like protein